MKNLSNIIFSFLLLFFFDFSFAQASETEVDSTYLIYQEQLKDLYISRGLGSSKKEIDSIMSLYKTNQISSNENFAQILIDLYSFSVRMEYRTRARPRPRSRCR